MRAVLLACLVAGCGGGSSDPVNHDPAPPDAAAVTATCGNGLIEPGEVCDDHNNLDGDGCSANCLSVEACGNGIVDVAAGEECDDGNTNNNDGCTSDCKLGDSGPPPVDGGSAMCPPPYTGPIIPTCGNAIVDVASGEQCDDGNTNDGDGCDHTCHIECH